MNDDCTVVSLNDLIGIDAELGWPEAIALVSLDRVRPFLGELDLCEESVAKGYPGLRDFVREHDGWMHEDDNDDTVSVASWLSDKLTRLLVGYRDVASATDVLALRGFVTSFIGFQHVPAWRTAWWSLLKRLVSKYTVEGLVDNYAIGRAPMTRVFEIASQFSADANSVDARMEEADQQALQGWDAEAYALYRRESPELTPLTALKLYLEEKLFDQTWWKLIAILAPSELDELERWGTVEVMVSMTSTSASEVRLPVDARTPR